MLIVFTMLSAMALCRSKARVIFIACFFINRLKAPLPTLPLDNDKESLGTPPDVNLTQRPKIGITDRSWGWSCVWLMMLLLGVNGFRSRWNPNRRWTKS